MQDRLALDKGVDRLVDAGARLEQELAGLELPALPVEERIGLEQARLVDDALALQELGDFARAGVARNDDDLVGLERPLRGNLPVEQGKPENPGCRRARSRSVRKPLIADRMPPRRRRTAAAAAAVPSA